MDSDLAFREIWGYQTSIAALSRRPAPGILSDERISFFVPGTGGQGKEPDCLGGKKDK